MIEKYIKELLFKNDLVAIPGFGCFVCTYAEAELNILNNKLYPPSKKIAFNEKIHSGDSENLVSYIADQEQITLEESKSLLFRFSGEVKYKINTEKQYVFDELGRFYTLKDGSLAFEQFIRFNYNEDSFGLPQLYIRPIDKNAVVEPTFTLLNATNISNNMNTETNSTPNPEINEDDLEYIEAVERSSSGLTWYYIAAVFSLFFVLGTAYYLNMDKETYAIGSFNPLSFLKDGNSETFSDKDADISKNKLLPENAVSSEAEVVQETAEITESTPNESASEIKEPKKVSAPKIENTAPEIDLSNAITSKTGRFYIIVGSFKKSSTAQNLLSDLTSNGLNAKIVAQDGNTETVRVSASDFDTYEEASAKKTEISTQTGTEAWILKY